MKSLTVDEKWSIDYDDKINDKPLYWRRYGEIQCPFVGNNAIFAMFYALLDARDKEVTN